MQIPLDSASLTVSRQSLCAYRCDQPSQGVCRRIARADDWLYYMLRSPIRPLLRVHVQVRQQSTPKVAREALNARQFRVSSYAPPRFARTMPGS